MIKKILTFAFLLSILTLTTFQTYYASNVQFYLSEEDNSSPDYYALISEVSYEIPEGASDLYIYTPLISDWYKDGTIAPESPEDYSYLYFFSSEDVAEYQFIDIDTSGLGSYDVNTLRIDLALSGLDDYDFVAFKFWFELPVWVDKNNDDNNFVDFWNEHFEVTFDVHPDAIGGISGSPIYIVSFRHDLKVWYQTYANGIPPRPLEPVRGQDDFYGWRFEDYNFYQFNADLEPPSFPLPPELEYTLYSSFTTEDGAYDGEIDINDDSRLAEIMTMLGLYNTAGRVIVYVIIVLIMTFGLILLHMPPFVVVIINLLVSGVFTFMGWLPFYAVIILTFTLLTFVIVQFKRGG